MLHERTPERTIAGVTEATAISIHSDDSNDDASTSKDDASAVASAVFTNDDTGTVAAKGAVAAKDVTLVARRSSMMKLCKAQHTRKVKRALSNEVVSRVLLKTRNLFTSMPKQHSILIRSCDR